MTPTTTTRLRRTLVLTVAATSSLIAATPAVADVPEGWSDPDPVSGLDALLLLGGVPLLLLVLIALAVYLPAMMRGESVAPGSTTPAAEWFGGPSTGTHELGSGSGDSETGGASGRW